MRVLLLHASNDIQELLLLLLTSVRKVESKDVGTRQKELFNHGQVGRGRSERDDLLGGLAPPLRDLGDSRDGRLAGGFPRLTVGGGQGRSQRASQRAQRACLDRQAGDPSIGRQGQETAKEKGAHHRQASCSRYESRSFDL
jgi:hypothetical protein